MSIIELMHHIIHQPAPRLPAHARYTHPSAESFVSACLEKEVDRRGTPGELLGFEWVREVRESRFDVEGWAGRL